MSWKHCSGSCGRSTKTSPTKTPLPGPPCGNQDRCQLPAPGIEFRRFPNKSVFPRLFSAQAPPCAESTQLQFRRSLMMRKLSLCAALLAMLLGAPYLFAGSGSYVMGYSPAGGVTLGQAGGPPYTSAPALFDYSSFNGSSYQSL